MLLEDRKSTLLRDAKSSYFSLLLTADLERRERLKKCSGDADRPHSVRCVRMEQQILRVAEREPTIRTRLLTAHVTTSHASVQDTLQEQQLYPYYIQFMQELAARDTSAGRAFSQWILRHSTEETKFRVEVFFTYQSCFTRTEITNIHNEHMWSTGNHSITTFIFSEHTYKQQRDSSACCLRTAYFWFFPSLTVRS
jgi:hypothetical protein